MQKDCHTVWNNCLHNIRNHIGDQSFRTWFSPITPTSCENNVLTIQVPSQYFYEYLEEHYVHLLRKALDDELGKDSRLEYSVVVDQGNETQKPYTINYGAFPQRAPQSTYTSTGYGAYNGNGQQVATRPLVEAHLNPNYTFESYIEGDCNRLARQAGQAVAKQPGVTSFNPLMIYGGVGLGKTHLVQAVGNDIRMNSPEKTVVYVSSEKFTQQFIEAVRNNKVSEFTNSYLLVDVLILDDVQFLSGKEKTQETFFHIFNHLHQLGKQIIMTSDCPPKDLKGLQERLLSRFKWGLTADLQQPDFETKFAIIMTKMDQEGITLPDNVIEYLAYSVDTNVRELVGVLISLVAQASLNQREIDLELAKQTMMTLIHDIDTEVSVDFIQKTVSEYFKVHLDDLKAKTRKKEIVIARQVAMYFAKEYTNHSLKSIGYHFGGRDHSTVIHAVQSVNNMNETDARFRAQLTELQKKLKMKSV
ncbi:MAG: chromosomal replication initiator protein DnaA [Bacteroidota bacterium]